MATEAKPASPQYTLGQRVEVLATDFPGVWETGTIVAMQRVEVLVTDADTGTTAVADWGYDGCWDVQVARNNDRPPVWQLVAERGGNKYIQAL